MYKVMCFSLLLLFCLFFVLCFAVIMLGNRKTTRYTATFLGFKRFLQQTCRHLQFYNSLGHQVRSPSLVGQIYYKINSHKFHQSDWPALSLFPRGRCLVRLSLSFTLILFQRLYRMMDYYPIILSNTTASLMTTFCTGLATFLSFLKSFIQLSLAFPM